MINYLTLSYTKITTSIEALDLPLSEHEYNVLLKTLKWLRETEYGSLHLEINTYKDKLGAEQKVIDVSPTKKERIHLEASS